MSKVKPLPEWWYQDEQEGSREQCRLAGLALHLLDSLPDPEITNDYGYSLTERVRQAARAVGIVVPGTFTYDGPDNADELAARLLTARTILGEVLNDVPDGDGAGRVLVGIALDALGGPVEQSDDDEEGDTQANPALYGEDDVLSLIEQLREEDPDDPYAAMMDRLSRRS